MELEEVKKIVEEILTKMNVGFDEILIDGNKPSSSCLLIKTKESGPLIGTKGANLSALNHLIKRIVSQKTGNNETKFFVDVNNYQERSSEELMSRIKSFSDKAKAFGLDVSLPPMSSYERMLVHSRLAEDPELETVSEGDGENRHVVIRFKQVV